MFLILAVLFALGIAFFATQNTGLVSIRLAQSVFPGIPLYMVMIISMLVGMFMAWIVSLFDNVGSLFALRGKDASIRQAQNTVNALERKIQNLEEENSTLRRERAVDEHVHQENPIEAEAHPIHHPNPFFPNLRSMFR